MSDGRDREIIVTNQGGSGVGMIIAAVILSLGVVLAIWYFNNSDAGGAIPEDIDININTGDPETATTVPVN